MKEGIEMFRAVVFISLMVFLLGCGESEDVNSEKNRPDLSQIKVTKDVVKAEKSDDKSKENSGQFYYSYNKKSDKEVGKYNSDTSKVRTTIDAYLNIKSPYERVRITMMIKRLSKDYIIKCSPCHDDYANGVIGPSLLDKDGEFIYQRIMDFKRGVKKNALMKELVSQIDDEKLRSIADEIANFNKEIRKMRRGK
jgi:cytochrome c553